MFWVAVLLGIVEGLTEFLPISSTGHLIVTNRLLGFDGIRAEVFAVFIQLGAILAVVWEYRAKLTRVTLGLARDAASRAFAGNLLLAFLPAAVIGFLIHDFISARLFSPLTVALALIAGGLLIFVVEALPLPARTRDVDSVGWKQALGVGVAQCVAMWPGFSRSAATILGGMIAGLDRRTATEFSFFLAIPTMFAATVYDLVKNYERLAPGDLSWLALSFVISFLVAWASVRWLLRFVSTHSFRAFAWYRLAFGGIILLVLYRA
ncbi:MAG TPA: undecaprenyl-diphosphate phosphatase [Candidatus Polarisedimenticolaceae bacterium]|nr:undecaprenyl-diphosphate phosphatase [Candidatus Polarisedimenticolaceae bacterium]